MDSVGFGDEDDILVVARFIEGTTHYGYHHPMDPSAPPGTALWLIMPFKRMKMARVDDPLDMVSVIVVPFNKSSHPPSMSSSSPNPTLSNFCLP